MKTRGPPSFVSLLLLFLVPHPRSRGHLPPLLSPSPPPRLPPVGGRLARPPAARCPLEEVRGPASPALEGDDEEGEEEDEED
eukprot:2656268-Pyramimonas_sp.AAC.1